MEFTSIEAQISSVERDIVEVNKSILQAEVEVKSAADHKEKDYWRREKEQLRNEKEQLRKKEEQLRKKEEQLREEKLGMRGPGSLDREMLQNILNKIDPISQACLENVSATMSASRATREKLHIIHTALGVVPGPVAELERLIGREPADEEIGFDWDGGFNATENQMREEYAKMIQDEIKKRTGLQRGLEWIDARGKTIKRHFEGVPFPVSGRNDEVLIIQGYRAVPELGAILGVELKKKLTWRAFFQMEAEFYLWSDQSVVPFVQSMTDLNTGGIACYIDCSSGKRVLRYKILTTMTEFFDYLADLVKQLPAVADLVEGPSCFPDELPAPKRYKLGRQLASVTSQAQGQDVWKMLWSLREDERDIACLEDVEHLGDWGIQDAEVPSYFS